MSVSMELVKLWYIHNGILLQAIKKKKKKKKGVYLLM